MATAIPARLTAAEGRRFAWTVGAAFVVLSGIALWRGHTTIAAVLAGLGVTLGLAGTLVPAHLGPVYRGWMRFALLLSRVTTPLFLGVVYFVLLAPVGLVMRLAGRHPLRRHHQATTVWVTRPAATRRRLDMDHQF